MSKLDDYHKSIPIYMGLPPSPKELVTQLNCDFYESIGNDSFYEDYEAHIFIFMSDGDTDLINFLGVPIWDSENYSHVDKTEFKSFVREKAKRIVHKLNYFLEVK